MHPETLIFVPQGIGFVPYTIPGTEAIAEATIRELHHHNVIIWEKHGCLAVGNSVLEAFDQIDILAKSAQIFFLCKGAGYEPQGLTDEQLEEIRQTYLS
jgi:rhamnulose-1-phosphate aldolase